MPRIMARLPFYELYSLLTTQLTNDLSDFSSYAAEKHLLSVLRDDHHMVFSLSFCMG